MRSAARSPRRFQWSLCIIRLLIIGSFAGPPVRVTARVHTTPRRQRSFGHLLPRRWRRWLPALVAGIGDPVGSVRRGRGRAGLLRRLNGRQGTLAAPQQGQGRVALVVAPPHAHVVADCLPQRLVAAGSQSTSRPVSQSASQPVRQSASQAVSRGRRASVSQAVSQSASQPAEGDEHRRSKRDGRDGSVRRGVRGERLISLRKRRRSSRIVCERLKASDRVWERSKASDRLGAFEGEGLGGEVRRFIGDVRGRERVRPRDGGSETVRARSARKTREVSRVGSRSGRGIGRTHFTVVMSPPVSSRCRIRFACCQRWNTTNVIHDTYTEMVIVMRARTSAFCAGVVGVVYSGVSSNSATLCCDRRQRARRDTKPRNTLSE
eukprot:1189233-Prorocentrum_minimum.AAC.1